MAEILLERAIISHKGGTPIELPPTPKNVNVKILEDGTVTKADPTIPEFSYSPPLSEPPIFTPEKKSGATPLSNIQTSPTDGVFAVPSASESVEQMCCLNEIQPCKHWKWDINSGEGYVNTLSGRIMEVE